MARPELHGLEIGQRRGPALGASLQQPRLQPPLDEESVADDQCHDINHRLLASANNGPYKPPITGNYGKACSQQVPRFAIRSGRGYLARDDIRRGPFRSGGWRSGDLRQRRTRGYRYCLGLELRVFEPPNTVCGPGPWVDLFLCRQSCLRR